MPLTSPLKWAGSKRWLVPQLQSYWDWYGNQYGNQTRLVEPFAGALNVAFGLEPKRALLNDINPHLMQFHRFCQQGKRIPVQFVNERESYLQMRALFNGLTAINSDSEAVAWIFYYLNRNGFNGLCRYSKSGNFNTPFGRYKNPSFEYDFSDYAPIMQGWELRCDYFSSLQLETTDLLYIDPPYDGCEFTQYNGHKFEWDEQIQLARWAATHTGPVIVSNGTTDRILKLYQREGFEVSVISGRRNSISSKAESRTTKSEMFATRNIPAEMTQLEVAA